MNAPSLKCGMNGSVKAKPGSAAEVKSGPSTGMRRNVVSASSMSGAVRSKWQLFTGWALGIVTRKGLDIGGVKEGMLIADQLTVVCSGCDIYNTSVAVASNAKNLNRALAQYRQAKQAVQDLENGDFRAQPPEAQANRSLANCGDGPTSCPPANKPARNLMSTVESNSPWCAPVQVMINDPLVRPPGASMAATASTSNSRTHDVLSAEGAKSQGPCRGETDAARLIDARAAREQARAELKEAKRAMKSTAVAAARDVVVQSASVGNRIAQAAQTIAGFVGRHIAGISNLATGIAGGVLSTLSAMIYIVQGTRLLFNARRDIARHEQTLAHAQPIFAGNSGNSATGFVNFGELDLLGDPHILDFPPRDKSLVELAQNHTAAASDVSDTLRTAHEFVTASRNTAMDRAKSDRKAAKIRVTYGALAASVGIALTAMTIVGTGGAALLAIGVLSAVLGAAWLGYTAVRTYQAKKKRAESKAETAATAATNNAVLSKTFASDSVGSDVQEAGETSADTTDAVEAADSRSALGIAIRMTNDLANYDATSARSVSLSESGEGGSASSSDERTLRGLAVARYLGASGMAPEIVDKLKLDTKRGKKREVVQAILVHLTTA